MTAPRVQTSEIERKNVIIAQKPFYETLDIEILNLSQKVLEEIKRKLFDFAVAIAIKNFVSVIFVGGKGSGERMLELEADECEKKAPGIPFARTTGKRLTNRQIPIIISKNVINAAENLIGKMNKVRQFFYILPRMKISYSVPQNVLKSEEKLLILKKILDFLEAKPLLTS